MGRALINVRQFSRDMFKFFPLSHTLYKTVTMFSHFTERRTKAQGQIVTCPGSQS